MSKDNFSITIQACTNCKQHQWNTRHCQSNYSSLSQDVAKHIKAVDDSINVEIIRVSGQKLGSFQIYCNQTLLFSKINLGYFPHVPSVVTRIFAYINDVKNGQDLTKYYQNKASPIRGSSASYNKSGKSSPKKQIRYVPQYKRDNQNSENKKKQEQQNKEPQQQFLLQQEKGQQSVPQQKYETPNKIETDNVQKQQQKKEEPQKQEKKVQKQEPQEQEKRVQKQEPKQNTVDITQPNFNLKQVQVEKEEVEKEEVKKEEVENQEQEKQKTLDNVNKQIVNVVDTSKPQNIYARQEQKSQINKQNDLNQNKVQKTLQQPKQENKQEAKKQLEQEDKQEAKKQLEQENKQEAKEQVKQQNKNEQQNYANDFENNSSIVKNSKLVKEQSYVDDFENNSSIVKGSKLVNEDDKKE